MTIGLCQPGSVWSAAPRRCGPRRRRSGSRWRPSSPAAVG